MLSEIKQGDNLTNTTVILQEFSYIAAYTEFTAVKIVIL